MISNLPEGAPGLEFPDLANYVLHLAPQPMVCVLLFYME
jgi:hypothetical protein